MREEAKNIQEWHKYLQDFVKHQIDPFLNKNLYYLSEDIRNRIRRQIIAYLVNCDIEKKEPDPKEITKIVNKEAGTSYVPG